MGGPESLGFQFTSCPVPWTHSPFLRTFCARLYRMGTRRRQLAHRRFHVFLPRFRRIFSVAHFYAFLPQSRRIASKYTFARASSSPEGSNLLRMTMDSRWDSEDSRCSYTAFLPFCLDSEEPGQVVEKKAFLAHYVARSLPCEKPKSFTIPSTV
jgi:hypothetical protein